jgi:hypothetical protein
MERIELDNLTYYQVELGSICLLGFSPEELVKEKFRKALSLGATGYTIGPSISTI